MQIESGEDAPPDETTGNALRHLTASCYAELLAIARRERRGAGSAATLEGLL